MNPDIISDGGPAKRKRCGGGRAFHSRLEPFVDFIREQRQRRRTWQEIAAVLFSEKNCAITAQADYLLTEDAHFAALAEAGYRPRPLSPQQFIAQFVASGK